MTFFNVKQNHLVAEGIMSLWEQNMKYFDVIVLWQSSPQWEEVEGMGQQNVRL